MGAFEKLIELRWRAAGHMRALPPQLWQSFDGARGLEIGGPSSLFGANGLLPVYPKLATIDGVQWAAETVWHRLDSASGYAPEDGAVRGELHVTDSIDLDPLASGSYDVVLSSHVIEHLANPLRALAAWRRVTRAGGQMLIVAPHMQGTFDHRRALTTLAHIVEDFERSVEEDDMTHLEETLRLHDRARDVSMDDTAWEQMRRNNSSTRTLHHHTFTTPSLLALLDRAGLELIACETRFPHDIYVLGRWPASGERPDNTAFLASPRRSPFSADRR
ncbi:MAG TPA: methyltransferase domain-containing protein [Solirubrobacteraceae bacterium]|jgi:SAM-dependent methyltransferase|nr:methyltransferase domain-containing protein [Solirubrobacteraceae bacterium]